MFRECIWAYKWADHLDNVLNRDKVTRNYTEKNEKICNNSEVKKTYYLKKP